ncbi:MAG: hypothetical protein EP298_01455 [Gammaproteobacteria bacterium]|nr:MAG: hypothetical protein EP298_01455 [Gammaproteobacteria bacterium]UTW42016.1 hypothetical protein KFE69_10965 [bacterium SCSIO 12844]
MRIKSKAELQKRLLDREFINERHTLKKNERSFFLELLEEALVIDELISNMDNPDRLLESAEKFNESISRLLSPFKAFTQYDGDMLNKHYQDEQAKKKKDSYDALLGKFKIKNAQSIKPLMPLIEKLFLLKTIYQIIKPTIREHTKDNRFERECSKLQNSLDDFFYNLKKRTTDDALDVRLLKLITIEKLTLNTEFHSGYIELENEKKAIDEAKANLAIEKRKLSKIDRQLQINKNQLVRLMIDDVWFNEDTSFDEISSRLDNVVNKRQNFLLNIAKFYCEGGEVANENDSMSAHGEEDFELIFGNYFNYNNGDPRFKEGVIQSFKFDEVVSDIFLNCKLNRSDNRFERRLHNRQCGKLAAYLNSEINNNKDALLYEVTQGDIRNNVDYQYRCGYQEKYLSSCKAIRELEINRSEQERYVASQEEILTEYESKFDDLEDKLTKKLSTQFSIKALDIRLQARSQKLVDEVLTAEKVNTICEQKNLSKGLLSDAHIVDAISETVRTRIYEMLRENHDLSLEDEDIDQLIEVNVILYLKESTNSHEKSNFLRSFVSSANERLSMFGGGDKVNDVYHVSDFGLVPKNIAVALNNETIIEAYNNNKDITCDLFKKLFLERLREVLNADNADNILTYFVRQEPTKLLYQAVQNENQAESYYTEALQAYIDSIA